MKRKKILFVCTGNTCRSPMAEILLRAEIKKRKIKFIDVASAGLKVSKQAVISPFSKETLEENGYTVPAKFKPRQLTDKIFNGAYVVITMTKEQKALMAAHEKVFCMSELSGEDISDPYGQGKAAYEKTFTSLQTAVKKIADDL